MVSKRIAGSLGTLLLVVAMVLGACAAPPKETGPGPAAPSGSPAKPKDLRIGMGAEPWTLDASDTVNTQSLWVAHQIMQTLAILDKDQKPVPMLAEGWKWVNDKTLEVKLRPGLKFTNGESANAAAAKYSLEFLAQSVAHKGSWPSFAGVDVVDDLTFRIKLKYADPILLPTLTIAYMLPPKYHAEAGKEVLAQKPIGTGPYKLAQWNKGQEIVLDANPGYWGTKPTFSKISYRPISEPMARIAALEAGELDLIADVPINAIGRLQANNSLQVYQQPGTRVFMVQFDLLKAPADSPVRKLAFRQAVDYAIDREKLIKDLLQGNGTTLEGQQLTPFHFGFNKNLKATPYDPEKAKQLLAQAGYPNGVDLEFKYPNGRYQQDKELAEAITGQLAKVGIRTKLTQLEAGEFLKQLVAQGLGPMFYIGYGSPILDAHSQLRQNRSDFRYSYYKDQGYDDLLDKAVATLNEGDRLKFYEQITTKLHDEVFAAQLFTIKDVYAASKKLQGWAPRPDQMVYFFGDEKLAD